MGIVTFVDANQELDEIITTRTGTVMDVRNAVRFSVQCVVDVNTPGAKAFAEADVDPDEDTITEAAHGYPTGLKGQFTTATTLPAGLSLATDYFVIRVDANTYQVATTLVNALAGTAVDITDAGTGPHTFTPTALAGGAVKLLKSNLPKVLQPNYTFAAGDWSDVAAATSITADATVWFEVNEPAYSAALLHYTLTAGMMSTDNYVVVKGWA